MGNELDRFLATVRAVGGLDDEELKMLDQLTAQEFPVQVPAEFEHEPAADSKLPDTSEIDLRSRIMNMNVPERLRLAMFGNSIARSILVMDSSRLVQLAAFNNPRMTEGEVEGFAKNQQMPQLILREIGSSRGWTRSYTIKLHLVMNPRTPQDVALKWLRYLRKSELRRAAKSKNIPQIVALTARKILASQE